MLAHGFNSQRADQPNRTALDEAFDILAANQGDVLAKALAIHFDEAGAVFGLLGLHFLEHFGGVGIGVAQAVDEIAVDAGVFFFEEIARATISRSERSLKFLAMPYRVAKRQI